MTRERKIDGWSSETRPSLLTGSVAIVAVAAAFSEATRLPGPPETQSPSVWLEWLLSPIDSCPAHLSSASHRRFSHPSLYPPPPPTLQPGSSFSSYPARDVCIFALSTPRRHHNNLNRTHKTDMVCLILILSRERQSHSFEKLFFQHFFSFNFIRI